MAKPRPLRREVSASSNELEATSLTCLHLSRAHSSNVPHQEDDVHDCPLLSVKLHDFKPVYLFILAESGYGEPSGEPWLFLSIGRTYHFTKVPHTVSQLSMTIYPP